MKNEIKILEIGSEGGTLDFYAVTGKSKTHYVVGSNLDKKYQSVEEMLLDYSKNNDSLLWYYPVNINPDYKDKLVPVLLNEFKKTLKITL